MTTDNNLYYGLTNPATGQGDWNQFLFLIQSQILNLNTSLPVEVLSVNATGVNPVGHVSIRILVDQLTGDNKTIPHGEIPNVPYFRLQGGNNAVIIDPEIGDIGMANFASRDITAVKNARMQAPPGSLRSYDFSDAMYSGGYLNKAPTQYIQFTAGGILIHSPSNIKLQAPIIDIQATTVNIAANLNVTGNAAFTGTMNNNGVNIGSNHQHNGSPTAPNGPISNTGTPI